MKRSIEIGALVCVAFGLSIGARAQSTKEIGWTEAKPPAVSSFKKAPPETIVRSSDCTNLPLGLQTHIGAIGDDGAVFVQGGGKLSRRCAPGGGDWDFGLPDPGPDMGLGTGVGGIAADALGNLYYTFVFMNSESEHSFAVRVGKMTPSGSEAWTSLIDGYEHENMSSLAVGPGKTAAVYVSATSTSQMPGHPPAAKGHPVVAKFGTNGKTTWLKQSASFGRGQSHGVRMAADLSGNVYILPINTSDIGNTILKLDNQGTVVWQATLVVPRDRSRASLSNLEVSPDGKSIYVLGTKDNSLLVIKLDPSGRQQWVRITETRHSVVLDPVEGVRWDGTGRRLSSLYASASNEALYVAFPYWNTYVHGSRPREPHTDVLVAAFNQASGKLQWARQYGLSSTGQQRGNLEYIQAMPNGELVVAAKIPTKPPGYDLNHAVFRLRPSGDPVTPTQPAKAPSKKAK